MPTPYKELLKKFFGFSCVGAVGTLAQFIILTGLVEWFAVYAVIASDIGMVIGAIINYFLSYHLVFDKHLSHQKTLVKFFTIATIGLGFNSILMHAALYYMPYLLAQIFATGITLFWNFLANYYWTFNIKQPSV